MKLFQLFSTNRSKLFVESVDKLLNTVDTALILFKEGVRSYLYNDAESFSQTLSTMAYLCKVFEIEKTISTASAE